MVHLRRGGIIVFGVTETNKAADARQGVGELTESHERTIRQVRMAATAFPVLGAQARKLPRKGRRLLRGFMPLRRADLSTKLEFRRSTALNPCAPATSSDLGVVTRTRRTSIARQLFSAPLHARVQTSGSDRVPTARDRRQRPTTASDQDSSYPVVYEASLRAQSFRSACRANADRPRSRTRA